MNLLDDELVIELRKSIHNIMKNSARAEDELKELGVIGFTVPLHMDGLELGFEAASIVMQEMGRSLMDSALLDTMIASDFLVQLDQSQRFRELLHEVKAGNVSILVGGSLDFGQSRPEYTIEEHEHYWIINGSGGFITYSEQYSYILYLLRLNEEFIAVLIPRHHEGLNLSIRKTISETDMYSVDFNNLVLTREHMIGTLNINAWDSELLIAKLRVRQASYLLGLSEGALLQTINYTSTRRQFDEVLAKHQSVEFRLAALYAEMEAVKLKLGHALWLTDCGSNSYREATEALAMSSELALSMTRAGIHYHGAHGLTEKALIQLFYRKAIVEVVKFGNTDSLWLEAGKRRIAEANEFQKDAIGHFVG